MTRNKYLPTKLFYLLAVNISRIFRQKKTGFLNFVFSKDHYILIQNNLKQFEINELKKIGDPGIFFQKSQKRIYPQHNLFCHITGFISKFYIPKSKLEKNLNTTLNNGKDVKLSLDLRIQTIVKSACSRKLHFLSLIISQQWKVVKVKAFINIF